MMKKINFLILFLFFTSFVTNAQDVALYKQFAGRYDFYFTGNTLNLGENGINPDGTPSNCTITTQSSATLNLAPTDVIENAYLYWAGSGMGDFDVKLNGENITATRKFSLIQPSSSRPFFSAFADVTKLLQDTGNGNYTLTDLDLTKVFEPYCDNATNFGGWAIVIVYKNNALPINQINIYDGLQFIQRITESIKITLSNLDVIDSKDAKIGFVAWEGDKNLAVSESLKINGNILSNALNPPDNAFNGTNGFTGSTTLYNMDLDVYNIQNNINIGDTSATIELTSNQDFVMINVVVTKLNSKLPDATIKANTTSQECNTKKLNIDYTVSNLNCTTFLPSNTFITFYINDIAVGTAQTTEDIPIDESRNYQTTITIPPTINSNFELKLIVDDNNGVASVLESIETNNEFVQEIILLILPKYNIPENLTSCNEGYTKGTFNFSSYYDSIKTNPSQIVAFFSSEIEAINNANPIVNTSNYIAQSTPFTIYVRIEDERCFSITDFELLTLPCPPTVYNHFTPNNDGYNDTFHIEGLRNIFLNHQLYIYNRWGTLVWAGNNNTPEWDGISNQPGIIVKDYLPDGTYYYILELNELNYKTRSGFVFFDR
jgi:gliding motility-associated-like protein